MLLPIFPSRREQLRTRDNGRAEVEFEDGSTLRIIPNTTVEFSRLGLSDAGQRISTVDLVEGRAYVNWLGKSGDEFTLNFSQERYADQLTRGKFSEPAEIARRMTWMWWIPRARQGGQKQMISFDVNDAITQRSLRISKEDPVRPVGRSNRLNITTSTRRITPLLMATATAT